MTSGLYAYSPTMPTEPRPSSRMSSESRTNQWLPRAEGSNVSTAKPGRPSTGVAPPPRAPRTRPSRRSPPRARAPSSLRVSHGGRNLPLLAPRGRRTVALLPRLSVGGFFARPRWRRPTPARAGRPCGCARSPPSRLAPRGARGARARRSRSSRWTTAFVARREAKLAPEHGGVGHRLGPLGRARGSVLASTPCRPRVARRAAGRPSREGPRRRVSFRMRARAELLHRRELLLAPRGASRAPSRGRS